MQEKYEAIQINRINSFDELFDLIDDLDLDDSDEDIIRDISTDYNLDDDPIDKIDIPYRSVD